MSRNCVDSLIIEAACASFIVSRGRLVVAHHMYLELSSAYRRLMYITIGPNRANVNRSMKTLGITVSHFVTWPPFAPPRGSGNPRKVARGTLAGRKRARACLYARHPHGGSALRAKIDMLTENYVKTLGKKFKFKTTLDLASVQDTPLCRSPTLKKTIRFATLSTTSPVSNSVYPLLLLM